MAEQDVRQTGFDFFPRLPIIVEAHAAPVAPDTSILPPRRFSRRIGLTKRFIDYQEDPRDPDQIDHTFGGMVRQRLFGILAGRKDRNDREARCDDPAFRIVSGRAPDDVKGPAGWQVSYLRPSA